MAKRALPSASSASDISSSPTSTLMVSAKRRKLDRPERKLSRTRSIIGSLAEWLPWRTTSKSSPGMDDAAPEDHAVAKIYPALPAHPPQIVYSTSTPEPLSTTLSQTLDASRLKSSGSTADVQQGSPELPVALSPVGESGESDWTAIQQVLQDGEQEVDDGALVPQEENHGLSQDQPIDLVESDDEEEEEPVEEVGQEETKPTISGIREVEAGPSRLPIPVHSSTTRRRLLLRPAIPTRSEIPQRTYTWERDDTNYGRPLSITPPRSAKISNRKERAIRLRFKFDRKPERTRKVSEAVFKIKRFLIGPTRLEEKAYIAQGATEGPESKDALSRLIQEKMGKPTLDTSIRIPTKSYQPSSTAQTTRKAKSQIQQSRPQEIEDIIQRLRLSKEEENAEAAARLRPTIPSKLKDEEEEEVDEALRDQSFRRMSPAAEVTAKSMRRLRPNIWLDDEIINYYGGLLTERSKADTTGKLPKIFYCSSFFYPKMQAGYNKSLSRWTKKVKVFELDLLVMPINLGNSHWTASAINIKEKRVEYYDSMGDYSRAAPKIFKTIKTWLEAEHQDKLGEPLDTSDWVLNYSDDTPQQDNGNDCGIFSCQTIEALTRGKDLAKGEWEFSAKDMPFFRRLMAYEIAKGKLYKRW